MAALATIDWLAVLTAAVATFLIGGLWYGPLFGRRWMAASGVGEERLREGGRGRIFGVAFLLQLVAAAVLALFVPTQTTVGTGALAGFAVGLFWVATSLGVIYLYERRPLAHWAVNAGYQMIAYAVMGAILGAWPG